MSERRFLRFRPHQRHLKQYSTEKRTSKSKSVAGMAAVGLIGILAVSMAIPVIGAQNRNRVQISSHVSSAVQMDETDVLPVEEDENVLIEQALLNYSKEHGNILTACQVSWYSEKVGYRTDSGFAAEEDCTIRVNTAIIPLLSDVCIAWPDGSLEWYKATDGGEAGNAVSIFTLNTEQAPTCGIKTAAVYWIPEGAIT